MKTTSFLIAGIAAITFSAGLPSTMASGLAMADDEVTPSLPASWLETMGWRSVGPANMSGRITSLAVYEADPTIWWAATASGGLLKTTNNGTTFTHQFDNEATVSIGQVAVAQSDPNIVWVGTGESNPRNSVSWGNGVYKSTDGGTTWTNMGLEETFQTGGLAIHPEDPNIVYVGSLGRLYGTNEARGLYKTTDGGETWEKILYIDDKTGVIDVDMNPSNPDELIVATYERQRDGFDTNDPAKKWGPGSGIYRTTDAGATFEKLSKGLPSMNIGRVGVDYYRADPNYIYAIVESEVIGKEPEDAPYIGITGEDADVGARLTSITDEGPAAAAGLQEGDIVIAIDDETVHSYNELLRQVRSHLAGDTVTVEVSRDRQSVLIDLKFGERPEGGGNQRSPFGASLGGQQENLQGQQGPEGYQYGGLYRSSDGGDSWERINSINPRPMYYSEVRVDPSDNKYIYVLGTSLYKSSDGGETFTGNGHVGRNGSVHVDHHAMWVDPNDGRHIILGNDGGVYVTESRMMEWRHHNHVAIGQFYHVGVGPRHNYRIYGGLQDNGSWGGPSMVRNDRGSINEDWFRVGGGDGFLCLVDPEDPDQIYSESQNGGMVRRHLKTGETQFLRPRGQRGTQYRFNWKTPFILSNHNSKIFYSAGNYVFRSLYKGNNQQRISPEITRTDRGSGTALSESPLDANVLYVGTDDGALWMTKDGGTTWENLFAINGDDHAEDAEEETPADDDGDIAVAVDAAATAQEEPAKEKPAVGSDPVTGLWSANATGDGIPADQGDFELELWLADDGEVTGSMKSDIGEGKILDGAFDASNDTISWGFDTGDMILKFEAVVKDDKMTGTISIEDVDFEMNFTAERGANPMLNPGISPRLLASASSQDEGSRVNRRGRRDRSRSADGTNDVRVVNAVEAPAVAAADDPISGEWTASAENPEMGGAFEFTLVVELKADNKASGMVSSQMGDEEFTDGVWNPEKKELKFSFDGDGMAVQFTCQVKGENMTGSLEVVGADFGAEFTAKRTKKPEPKPAPKPEPAPEAPAAAEAPASNDAPSERGEDFVENTIDQLLPKPLWVSSLEASRYEAGRVYVTFDGHRSDLDGPYVFASEDHGKTWRSLTTNIPDSAGSSRVIREDIRNANILWLGCEFGAWVSIDRGETWTSLSAHTNLPTVAVHEIAQHRPSGDIIAGTHGRSIWVMNATPIRQLAAYADSDDATLLRPNTVVYWNSEPSRGNTLVRFTGDNPSSNAMIYYLLPNRARSISLEVQSLDGTTIRTLDASGDQGLHRVVWNMRRQAPPAQQGRRQRGGARIAPGEYKIVLTADGETSTQTLRVVGDPDFPAAVLWGETYDERLDLLEMVDEPEESDQDSGLVFD